MTPCAQDHCMVYASRRDRQGTAWCREHFKEPALAVVKGQPVAKDLKLPVIKTDRDVDRALRRIQTWVVNYAIDMAQARMLIDTVELGLKTAGLRLASRVGQLERQVEKAQAWQGGRGNGQGA
jgi:hypothetical protein